MQNFFKSWKFKVLCGLAVLSLAIMIRAASLGNTEVFLSQMMSVISQPFLKASSSITNSVDNFLKRFTDSEELYLENEDLKNEVRELKEKLVHYESIKRENEQFRDFLKLKENNPDYDFEPASVIGRDATSRFSSFTIDKGKNSGVEISDPVITSDGLIGLVWQVGPTYAEVKTILDISVEVGAYSISTRDSGIITGDITLSADSLCLFKYIPKNSGISVGDVVVTSGIGGVYPKDLIVGKIDSIKMDSNGLSLTAVVSPSADISNVTDVIVIKSFNGQYSAVSSDNTPAEEGAAS